MIMKNDTEIEEDLTRRFKIDMKFTNFDARARKVKKKFCSNWLLVTKVYIVLATKV